MKRRGMGAISDAVLNAAVASSGCDQLSSEAENAQTDTSFYAARNGPSIQSRDFLIIRMRLVSSRLPSEMLLDLKRR